MAESKMEPTNALAAHIVQADYDDLPQAMIDAVKASILDTLGVAMAGAVQPAGKTVVDHIRDLGGTPLATVLGTNLRSSPPNAALANGTMIHALDYDDSLQIFSFHFSSFLLPTVLALGERDGISGKQFITAFSIGLDAAVAVFRAATSRRDYDLGWHRTATVGTLGSAAAGAKVLGLDVHQTRMALGIATSAAAGIRQNFGTMTKPLHSGFTARSGVTAAMLAHRGLTADANALEGKLGFCSVFFGAGHYDVSNIVDSIAHPYDYVRSMRIKKYPCCGQNMRPIDTMLALVREHDIRPEQVVSVECGINPSVMNILMYSDPKTGLEGKFSAEFCLAVALLDRKVVLGDFTDERVNDPRVREMMRKVTKHPDPTVPHSGGRGPIVTLRLADGREYSRRIDLDADQPWLAPTREERIAKYRDCAAHLLDDKKIDVCLELVEHLDELPDIRHLTSAISL